jgi:hypothetical protein
MGHRTWFLHHINCKGKKAQRHIEEESKCDHLMSFQGEWGREGITQEIFGIVKEIKILSVHPIREIVVGF